MSNASKKFKITVSIILAFAMIWMALISIAFFYHAHAEKIRREGQNYGIYVCGTSVQYKNAADVLGDGTVSYDPGANMLTLTNATLESNGSAVIFSEKDLTIVLDGENKMICNDDGSTAGIYASDYMLRKDISFIGGGSLIIEGNGGGVNSIGAIVANDIWAYSNLSIDIADVAEGSSGIECSNLYLLGENTISVSIDSTGGSNGVFVAGNVSMLDNSTLEVSNSIAGTGARGIECTGSFMARKGSTVNSTSGEDGFGILCHSVFFDYGANVNTEIDAIDGIRYETN